MYAILGFSGERQDLQLYGDSVRVRRNVKLPLCAIKGFTTRLQVLVKQGMESLTKCKYRLFLWFQEMESNKCYGLVFSSIFGIVNLCYFDLSQLEETSGEAA